MRLLILMRRSFSFPEKRAAYRVFRSYFPPIILRAAQNRTDIFASRTNEYRHTLWGCQRTPSCRCRGSRVGKCRLIVFLRQVCTDLSQNRACASQRTRLPIFAPFQKLFRFSSMMNSHVAFVAHNDCLAPLCQHDFSQSALPFRFLTLFTWWIS